MRLLLLFVLALQLGPGQPAGPITLPMPTVVCDGSEMPCDPNRPWVRGMVEKYCGRTPAQVEALRKEVQKDYPQREVKVCACQHLCDPKADFAEQTGGLMWDGRCETRCNPANCKCPRKCDS